MTHSGIHLHFLTWCWDHAEGHSLEAKKAAAAATVWAATQLRPVGSFLPHTGHRQAGHGWTLHGSVPLGDGQSLRRPLLLFFVSSCFASDFPQFCSWSYGRN